MPREKFPFNDLIFITKLISHTLSYSNGFIKPFIFIFIGSKFLNHIKKEFGCTKKQNDFDPPADIVSNKNSEDKGDVEDNDDYDIINVNFDLTLDKPTTTNNSIFKQSKSYSPCGSLTILDSINLLGANSKSYEVNKNNKAQDVNRLSPIESNEN